MSSYGPVLYFRSLSPECARVRQAIQKLGICVDMRNVTVSRRYRRELREVAGQLKVPCLVISGTSVHRADEIEKYLSLRYGVRE